MKKKLMFLSVALGCITLFGSCKKDYTCTCTTIVGPASSTKTHDIDKAWYNDAKNTCNSYESEANKALPGSTTCRL